MDFKELLKNVLTEQFPGGNLQFSEFTDELTVTVSRDIYVELCAFLKTDEQLAFILLEDLTAIDWATRKNRFTVVAHVFSIANSFRLKVKAPVDDKDFSIDTVSNVWQSANWHEREVFDMYGITFINHPDLRRMYMPEEFAYHPLRKEFPLMGIPGSLALPKKS